MANIYNSQLDAFELFHKIQEGDSRSRTSPASVSGLEALGNGIAGSAGAAISNAALYPVDLIITRIQVQRHLRKDRPRSPRVEYHSLADAVEKIYKNEGGLAGLYTGLLQDTGKTVADSFIFFVAYSLIRNRRLAARGGSKSLPALEELGVGFVAGSLTKLATTPIANIVTRQQTAVLLAADDPAQRSTQRASAREIAQDIMAEKGLLGFWSGYSASLILTINPSITFFLFETLKKMTLPRHRRDNPPAAVTFLFSAVSKACASSITYPFSLAKARLQSGSRRGHEAEKTSEHAPDGACRSARDTIFTTLMAIVRAEGVSALYEGLHLEVVRAFFNHGITMLVKQVIQRFLVRAYYVVSVILGRYRHKGSKRLAERAKSSVEYYNLAMARASDKLREAANTVAGKANETAEFIGEYVEEESGEWRELYGTTGLARWLETGRHES